MLDYRKRCVADLKRVVELIGKAGVERHLNVHRTTVARWLSGSVAIPGKAHQVIRMLLGDMPGTDGKWSGWRFHNGQLLSPGGDQFSAGDVLSLVLLRQQLRAREQEIARLKVRLAVAESAMPDAANEPRAGLITPYETERQAQV